MMRIQSVGLAALSGLALVGFRASAQAVGVVTTSGDIVTITFTGTVTSSTDPNGIFGCTTGPMGTCSTDNPYAADTYTAVYTFNTGVGDTQNIPGVFVQAEGGTSLTPSGDPPVTPQSPLVGYATVTVNDVTYKLGGAYFANLYAASSDQTLNALPNTLTANVADANGDQIFGSVTTTTDPPQFQVSITNAFGPVDFGASGASYVYFDCSSDSCAGFIDADIGASLVNDSTVPEPSTWVMMAVGFAGLAFAGYRRTRTAAPERVAV
jgi:hypothetical protein